MAAMLAKPVAPALLQPAARRPAAVRPAVTRAQLSGPSLGSAAVRAAAGPLRASLPAARPAAAPSARRAAFVPKATKFELGDGIEGEGDYSHLLAVAGFVAAWYQRMHINTDLLLKALAVYQLGNAVFHLLVRKDPPKDKITTVIGPAALAVYALNQPHISFLDTVTGLFGFYLAEKVEPSNLFWVFIASLVAAIYYGYGTLWYTAAVAAASVTRVWRATKDEAPIPLFLVGLAAVSGYAVYVERHVLWALILYLAQIVWGGVQTVRHVIAALD